MPRIWGSPCDLLWCRLGVQAGGLLRGGAPRGTQLRSRPGGGRQLSRLGRTAHAALTLAWCFLSRDLFPAARQHARGKEMNGPPAACIPVITRRIKDRRMAPGAATDQADLKWGRKGMRGLRPKLSLGRRFRSARSRRLGPFPHLPPPPKVPGSSGQGRRQARTGGPGPHRLAEMPASPQNLLCRARALPQLAAPISPRAPARELPGRAPAHAHPHL